MTRRSPARTKLLAEILWEAICHQGYGFPEAKEVHFPDGKESEWYAVIRDRYEDWKSDDDGWQRVDLDTIAKGLSLIRRAHMDVVAVKRALHDDHEIEVGGLVNPITKEPLHVGENQRKNILLADRSNGEDGDLDVLDCLAVLEVAMFGAVTFG